MAVRRAVLEALAADKTQCGMAEGDSRSCPDDDRNHNKQTINMTISRDVKRLTAVAARAALAAVLSLTVLLPVRGAGEETRVNAEPIYPVRERMEVTSLDGTWRFKLVEGLEVPAEWLAPGFDDGSWAGIGVPGTWETQGFKTPEYGTRLGEWTGVYRRSFAYRPEWAGRRVVLRLDGVAQGCRIYVNGHEAGEWGSSFTMCQTDITRWLREGENKLCIVVNTRSRAWKFDTFDAWTFCGITRSVELFSVSPRGFLRDVRFVSTVGQDNSADKCFAFRSLPYVKGAYKTLE